MMSKTLRIRSPICLRMATFLQVLVYAMRVDSTPSYVIKMKGNSTEVGSSYGIPCYTCEEVEYIAVYNVPHDARRLVLVNDKKDCNSATTTLIESTSRGNILYYDISLVDGVTCLPTELYEETQLIYEFPRCDAWSLCSDSVCASECSIHHDVHECEVEKPYTSHWEQKLRSSCLGENARVYTSAYDDSRGLLKTNVSYVKYVMRVITNQKEKDDMSGSPRDNLRLYINLYQLWIHFFVYVKLLTCSA
ncbi:p28 protein [Fig virus A]|uniref:p26 n=1 Tax=Fig closterovirus 2 TaxID=2809011 RepID=A0A8A0Y1J1_9CLOS|nr:p28 protein [Fig virus A]QSQ86327.1 p26 [Fig closterovirus 2]